MHNGWVYFEIRKGIYALPQVEKLANNLLTKCLNAAGYYQVPTMSGLLHHKWRLILFCLIANDFGIK